jgi:hypothetical protein
MSFEASQAVWNRSARRGTELLVLLAIADYVNEQKGVAWPGVPKLAKKARMSERQVQRAIRALERSGELNVFRNAGPKGTNLYQICLPAEDACTGDINVTGDRLGADVVSSRSSKGDIAVTQSVNEPIYKSTPIVPKGDDIDFWIRVSFDCFKQSVHAVRPHVLRGLSVAVADLNRNYANSLVKFYQVELLDSKEPPYSSRRHSPERLMLDLPRQLALAVQSCPPPKKQDFTIEDVHRYLKEKYGDCSLPNSLEELERPWYECLRYEVYDAMRARKETKVDCPIDRSP